MEVENTPLRYYTSQKKPGMNRVKNDEKKNNDKGELIDRTAWFTMLYHTSG